MSRSTLALIALVIGLAGAVGGYFYGLHQGTLAEAGKRDKASLQDLSALIDSHKTLISEAGAASLAMRSALARRSANDAQTTKDFKNALIVTESSRVGCVFPADVMRRLAAAQARAADAAASGIRNPLPATGASTEQP